VTARAIEDATVRLVLKNEGAAAHRSGASVGRSGALTIRRAASGTKSDVGGIGIVDHADRIGRSTHGDRLVSTIVEATGSIRFTLPTRVHRYAGTVHTRLTVHCAIVVVLALRIRGTRGSGVSGVGIPTRRQRRFTATGLAVRGLVVIVVVTRRWRWSAGHHPGRRSDREQPRTQPPKPRYLRHSIDGGRQVTTVCQPLGREPGVRSAFTPNRTFAPGGFRKRVSDYAPGLGPRRSDVLGTRRQIGRCTERFNTSDRNRRETGLAFLPSLGWGFGPSTWATSR